VQANRDAKPDDKRQNSDDEPQCLLHAHTILGTTESDRSG